MSATAVEVLGEGRFAVRGSLRFGTVPALWRETRALFRDASGLSLDLAAVTDVDSAGLALLIEWMREARRRGLAIHFLNMPGQMQTLARVSGLEGRLP